MTLAEIGRLARAAYVRAFERSAFGHRLTRRPTRVYLDDAVKVGELATARAERLRSWLLRRYNF
jgi:hypothetical protein